MVKGIAVSFGRQDQVPEFSIPSVQVLKRAPLNFETARCKVEMLYEKMKNSYAEHVRDNGKKGREFNNNDVDNGWSVVQHSHAELDWQNSNRKAHYDARYIPAASTIVITYSRSPQFQLTNDYHGQLSPEVISRSVPPLNRLSDSIWTIWTTKSGSNGRGLRYRGRDNVINPDTVRIMKGIFSALHQAEHVPWPGVTAGIDSMIGQALLGTPNGVATAWLIIDHHSILGRREPTVTIWTYLDNFNGHMTSEETDND
ncbi:MAG: hypothetical protein Q9228_005418 [Teloschistes exilis]